MSVECLALTNKPGYWIVWHTISYPSTGFAFPPPPPSKGLSESKIPHPTPLSSDGVATIHTEISPGDIARRIRQEKGHRAHEILGIAHLALRDKRRPLALEIRVIIEDFFRQGGEHVARGNAVYADAGFGPFDAQRSSEVPDGGLGCVVRSVVEPGQFSPFLCLFPHSDVMSLGWVLTITMLVVWPPP